MGLLKDWPLGSFVISGPPIDTNHPLKKAFINSFSVRGLVRFKVSTFVIFDAQPSRHADTNIGKSTLTFYGVSRSMSPSEIYSLKLVASG